MKPLRLCLFMPLCVKPFFRVELSNKSSCCKQVDKLFLKVWHKGFFAYFCDPFEKMARDVSAVALARRMILIP